MTSQELLPIHFRHMTLDDLNQVLLIDTLSFTLPWSERSYRFELTENPASRCWVAELDTGSASPVIVGILVIWFVIDEAHVATIATHPDYRRHSIARRLLAHSLLAAQEEGAERAFLEVRRGNLAAQTLYNQFGFVVVSFRPRYYADNHEDALLMTLEGLDVEKLRGLVD
jgi:ribosomal-protein-alanine N-acetyltransferase